MTPARFRWGMILILIGALLLLRNANVIGEHFWIYVVSFLPFFLIAVGVEKIFTKTRFEFISYLASVAMVAGFIWVAWTGTGSDEERFMSEKVFQQDNDPSVQNLVADIQLGGGDLTVRDATDDLVYARFKEYTQKPDISYSVEGSTGKIEMTGGRTKLFGGMVKVDMEDINDWYLSFSKLVPLVLNCSGDNSNIHLNLATTPLKQLRLEAHDAEIYVKLGDLEKDVDVDILGDNSELKLRVPNTSGIQITGTDYADYLAQQMGFEEHGGELRSPGFDTLNNKIRIKLDERLRSFTLQPF